MYEFLQAILHFDRHLSALTATYGEWIYALLFLIVFCETGLVVTPFLPGDSLLFAAGALAGVGVLDVWTLAGLLTAAAILGDTVNYHVGKFLGPQVLRDEKSRWLNRKHLTRTNEFFQRYGARTIVIARFVPIVRTLAPFVAGVGAMDYRRFIWFNVAGGVVWVAGFLGAGYFFGNVPFVKENFSAVIIGVIVISLIPLLVEVVRARTGIGSRAEPGMTDRQ